MDTTVKAIAHFDAGHVLPDYEPCIRPGHGHVWTARVGVSGEIRGLYDLKADLDTIVGELVGQNLNEMLPGVAPSPLGLAAYLLERMALRYPKISSVEVECSNGTSGEIRRTPRQL